MSLNPFDYVWNFSAVAAFLAAAVAWFGVWRGNRTAEINLSATLDLERIRFREQWIQNLREEMATTGSYLANVKSLSPEQIIAFSKANLKMLLLLNPEDEDYEELRLMAQMLHRTVSVGKKIKNKIAKRRLNIAITPGFAKKSLRGNGIV